MKYLVTVHMHDDPDMPYEEWANSDRELSRIVNRITPLMEPGDTMLVTDLESGEMQQERRKVLA